MKGGDVHDHDNDHDHDHDNVGAWGPGAPRRGQILVLFSAVRWKGMTPSLWEGGLRGAPARGGWYAGGFAWSFWTRRFSHG